MFGVLDGTARQYLVADCSIVELHAVTTN